MIELGILGKISNQVGGILSDLSEKRVNLFNYEDNDTLVGYYINSNNELISLGAGATKGWVTCFIEVKPKTHYISNNTIANNVEYITFYNSGKSPISNMTLQSVVNNKGFVTPENCKYVRMTVNPNEQIDISEFQVEKGFYNTPYKSYYYDAEKYEKEQLETHQDLISSTSCLKGYIGTDGVWHSLPRDTYRVTDYIRVSNDDLYFFDDQFNNQFAIILFDAEKNVISVNPAKTFADTNYGFIRFAQNVAYIIVTYNTDTVRGIKHIHGDGLANKWYIGNIEYSSEKVNCYSCYNLRPSLKLYALTDNLALLLDTANEKVIFTPDIDHIDSNKKIFEVADFDGLEDFSNLAHAYIWRDYGDTMVLPEGVYVYKMILLTANSIIYNATLRTDVNSLNNFVFTKSKIWNAATGPMPQMVTSEQKDGNYALKILPGRITYFNFLNSPVVYHGGSDDNKLEFGSYTGSSITGNVNDPWKCAPSCLYSTYNGVDFYIKYMFGFSGARYKMSGSETISSYPRYKFGEVINTSQFGAYNGGLKLKVRLNVVPSSYDINPDHSFDYRDELNITAATNAEQGVFTLSDASDIIVGDCVCITGTASGEWGSLANTSYPANDGGNGIFFMVTEKDGNNIKLATCIGNPHNPLFCTHIHATNEAWNGVVLSTGEEYPESWAIYVDTNRTDAFSYRLNSSELGLSRSCGLVVNSDNTVLYAADTATAVYSENKEQVTGRTDKLILPPLGIWKFGLKDIDDHSKYELLQGNVYSIYNMCRINNAVYAAGQGGESFISFNERDFCKIYNKGKAPACYKVGTIGDNVFIFTGSTRKEVIAVELK